MNDSTQIRVLGPVEIVTPAGDAVPMGGRQRSLLAALVISAGRAVPISSLQFVLWGDEPPPAADNTLQTYVSQLRHHLGHDAVVIVDHSYRLDVDADSIDSVRFERLLTQATQERADHERCRLLCRQALELWRGRAFGDLADEESFVLEAYRLDELRLATMELELESELGLGRHELIIGELELAVDEHPYREGLWYLLIEALARSDRRVEALRACERLRRVLAEAGLDAGDRLVERERAILLGTPRLD
jgi:DNA-binding SARP family transcriptional activator